MHWPYFLTVQIQQNVTKFKCLNIHYLFKLYSEVQIMSEFLLEGMGIVSQRMEACNGHLLLLPYIYQLKKNIYLSF